MQTYIYTVTPRRKHAGPAYALYLHAANRAEADKLARQHGKAEYSGTTFKAYLDNMASQPTHHTQTVDPFAHRKARVEAVRQLTKDKPRWSTFVRRLHAHLQARTSLAEWHVPGAYREDYVRAVQNLLPYHY